MARKSWGEGKTASIACRSTPGLRDKLIAAAKANGRSFAQEVEERLKASFSPQDKSKRYAEIYERIMQPLPLP